MLELVAGEVAGGGVGGRAVGAAVFARGDGFARDGLVDDVWGVGALLLWGGVEAGGLEGERLSRIVVCGRHPSRVGGLGKMLGGRGFGSDGQWLCC